MNASPSLSSSLDLILRASIERNPISVGSCELLSWKEFRKLLRPHNLSIFQPVFLFLPAISFTNEANMAGRGQIMDILPYLLYRHTVSPRCDYVFSFLVGFVIKYQNLSRERGGNKVSGVTLADVCSSIADTHQK